MEQKKVKLPTEYDGSELFDEIMAHEALIEENFMIKIKKNLMGKSSHVPAEAWWILDQFSFEW